MPIHLRLFLGVLGMFFLISCSSSKTSENDSDVLPDIDTDSHDSETRDDDSDTQEAEIVDDSDEVPEQDEDQDLDHEDFDDTDRINGYKRCYDEIPDDPYEGFFASPGIEYWVKGVLGYDIDYELKEEDLEKVTEIGLPFKDIRGIEKLVNLESVTFFDTDGNVYDFTPLSKLKKLKTLRISFTPPEERDPNEEFINMTCLDASFSLLTNLESIIINNTELKDVAPIEVLVNLKNLDLAYNKIEFLPENIGNLQKLESFGFVYNKVEDITPLKALVKLKGLALSHNNVENIVPIKNLVNLIGFYGQGNKIKNILPLTNLVNLIYLELNQNQIEEIPAEFVNLKKLQTLELSYNNITNLPDLQGLDSLAEISLSYNNLSNEDFVKLDALKKVQFLYASFNKEITKVPVMKNVNSLQQLNLIGNNITDLSGFADNDSFPVLKQLELQYNKIENAEPLRKRETLNRLSIGNNCIQDLSPLEELKERGTYISGMNEQLESCEDK